MPPIVVAASQNNFTFGVCDFGSSPPTVQAVDPAFGGNCVTACDGNLVAAGDGLGSQVQLVDITNPGAPVLRGIINTFLSGIGAIAINGNLVAAAELNGFRIVLIDFTVPATPTIVVTVNTPVAGFGSLAFTAARTVVGAGPTGPPTAVEVNFSSSPASVVTFAPPGFAGGFSLDADAAAGRIVLGNLNGTQVFLLNAATKAVISTVNTSLASVSSVAISGSLVLAGSGNSANVLLINFSTSPPTVTTFNPGYASGASGSQVAISASTGACGAIVGGGVTPVKLFNLAVTPPALLGTCNPGVQSVGSLSIGQLGGPPPAPVIAVTPTSLTFAATRVGTTSAPQPVTISNTGTQPLNVTGLASGNARFSATPAAPFTIAPGGSRVVSVTFAPNAEQTFTGTLTIASNDPARPTVTVALSGVGALPHISISPNPVAFGSVAICLAGTRQLTVTNTGGLPLTVSSISTTGPPFAASPASLVVPPGTNRIVTLTFTPSALGPASGTLTLNSDDLTNPNATAALSGNGLSTPPPAISATPVTLAFGAVPRQFFIGLRVTVANTGPCQALSVSLATNGAPFFVTDTDPTTVPPTTSSVAATVAPNSSSRFAVVCAPTALGAANGTLTITSNDPANPTVTIPLTGNGVDESPAALELVLDRSGSMADPVAGGTKMDALKRAVKMFADLLIPGQGDALGSVEFDDQVNRLTPLAPFTAAQRTLIDTDVDTLFPRGLTSIGGGLQKGQTELAGPGPARKAILVFTDGIENTPPMIAAVEPGVLSAGIEIYAVGLGRPEDISADKLGQLAASSNGHFFLSDDPLILRKNFVQVLADAFRQNMAADPILQVSKGQVIDVPVWITRCERRISFVLNWDNPASQLSLEVIAPDGTVFTPTSPFGNQLVRYGQRPGYRYYQIALPPLDPGSGAVIGPQQLGQWRMRVVGTALAGASERCTTSVFVESHLTMIPRITLKDSQSPLQLRVLLTDDGKPVNGAQVRATITSPTKPYSHRLRGITRAAALTGSANDTQGLSVAERGIRLLRQSGRPLIPTKSRSFKLKGTRGIYALLLPAPLTDGVYQIEITATGQACGGTFQRYASLAAFVPRIADAGKTTITITQPGPATVTATIVPKDAKRKRLGPGLANDIAVQARPGMTASIIDNLDGSYAVHLDWTGRSRPSKVTVTVAGARIPVGIPVRRR
jgi:hypothetical protein